MEKIVLTDKFSMVEIGPIYPENMILHVSLKALNHESEVVTLDVERYKIPLSMYLYRYLYIEEVLFDSISGFVYVTEVEDIEIVYEVLVYEGETLVEELVVTEFEMSFTFLNLKGNTLYEIYIVATYQTETESANRQVLLEDSFITLS